jgi:multiple sugar transport system permease protein
MKGSNLTKRYTKWGYIFAVPFVVAFLIFHFYPLVSTIYYAFCYLKHAGNTDPQFLPAIGQPLFKNFIEIFKAKSFWDALKNTIFFFVASFVPEWIMAFWLAATITDRRLKIKGRALFKTAFFFPKLVQGTTISVGGQLLSSIATFVSLTAVAFAMDGFGIEPEDLEFLMSVRSFIIVLTVFMHFGITFIYVVAGITGIPVEVFEAAEIDGANRLQTFFRVTLPCMKPMLFFITVVTVVDGLGMNDIPSYFGPYDTFRRNLTLMMYLQNQAFQGSYAYDRASAASLILLLMFITIAAVVYYFLLYDKDEAKLKKAQRAERRSMKKGA